MLNEDTKNDKNGTPYAVLHPFKNDKHSYSWRSWDVFKNVKAGYRADNKLHEVFLIASTLSMVRRLLVEIHDEVSEGGVPKECVRFPSRVERERADRPYEDKLAEASAIIRDRLRIVVKDAEEEKEIFLRNVATNFSYAMRYGHDVTKRHYIAERCAPMLVDEKSDQDLREHILSCRKQVREILVENWDAGNSTCAFSRACAAAKRDANSYVVGLMDEFIAAYSFVGIK